MAVLHALIFCSWENRGRDGENGKLSGTYAELICEALPDFFLFENVKGLYRTARHREFFEELKKKFREYGYSLTEQLVNALEFGAPQDRDRIILIGFRQDIIERLHLRAENGCLLDFPWEAHKQYKLDDVKKKAWPNKTPYKEGVMTAAPNNVIEDLTVEHWWRKNDVTHHPNENMFFSLAPELFVSKQKMKAMLKRNAISGCIVGVIPQPQHTETMRYIYTLICHAVFLLRKHWLFNHCQQILFCQMM